jgi:hypothetical protein
VTEIDFRIAGVTVSVVLVEIAPDLAVMTVDPTARVVASPAALTVATLGVAELHVTAVVRLAVVELLYKPVAMNC